MRKVDILQAVLLASREAAASETPTDKSGFIDLVLDYARLVVPDLSEGEIIEVMTTPLWELLGFSRKHSGNGLEMPIGEKVWLK